MKPFLDTHMKIYIEKNQINTLACCVGHWHLSTGSITTVNKTVMVVCTMTINC